MNPRESNKNLPAAETVKVWRLKHGRKGLIIFGYTNSKKLREFHEELFPEFYKDKNKLKDDDEWDPKEVDAKSEWQLKMRNGVSKDLKKVFPQLEWPEEDAWGTAWLLEEMVKRLDWLTEDDAADEILQAKEKEQENTRGEGETEGRR